MQWAAVQMRFAVAVEHDRYAEKILELLRRFYVVAFFIILYLCLMLVLRGRDPAPPRPAGDSIAMVELAGPEGAIGRGRASKPSVWCWILFGAG